MSHDISHIFIDRIFRLFRSLASYWGRVGSLLETETVYTHSLDNATAISGRFVMPPKSPKMSFYLVHIQL